MYFLKRNLSTIILYMLVFGVIGTMIAFFLMSDTYDYDEYYSLSDPLSTTQEDELSIQLNQTINNNYNNRVTKLEYSPESQYLQLSIDSASSDEISSIKSQFNELLDSNGIFYTEDIDSAVSMDGQYFYKALLIILSLIIGIIVGLLHSTMDRRIKSDEDVKNYLGQKSLGTF